MHAIAPWPVSCARGGPRRVRAACVCQRSARGREGSTARRYSVADASGTRVEATGPSPAARRPCLAVGRRNHTRLDYFSNASLRRGCLGRLDDHRNSERKTARVVRRNRAIKRYPRSPTRPSTARCEEQLTVILNTVTRLLSPRTCELQPRSSLERAQGTGHPRFSMAGQRRQGRHAHGRECRARGALQRTIPITRDNRHRPPHVP